jgi:hypothetical protein
MYRTRVGIATILAVVALAASVIFGSSRGGVIGPMRAWWPIYQSRTSGSLWTTRRPGAGPSFPAAARTCPPGSWCRTCRGRIKSGEERTLVLHFDGSRWSVVPTPVTSLAEGSYADVSSTAGQVWLAGSEGPGAFYIPDQPFLARSC